MPITVRCPACRKMADVSRAAIGQAAQCRDCKTIFPVPIGTGTLTVEWGVPLVGTKLPLAPPDEIRIGRADDNQLVLPGAKVSRHHTTVLWKDGEWIARDENSGNGTFVNGMKIREARLENHAGLGIGDFLIRVSVAYEPAQSNDTVATAHPPGAARQPAIPSADARQQTVVGLPAVPKTGEPPLPSALPDHSPPRRDGPGKGAAGFIRALIWLGALVLTGVVLYLLFRGR